MTDPADFNDAFRRAAAATLPPPPDPRDVARRALKRNRRLTHFLGALCLLFWLVACAGLIVHVIALNRLVVFLRVAPGLPWSSPNAATHDVDPHWLESYGTDLIHHSTPFVVASLICLLLAAVCTVSLILASRRATLHRIHLTLAELSSQLKQISPEAASLRPDPEQQKGTIMRNLLIIAVSLAGLTAAGVSAAYAADRLRPTSHLTSRPWAGYPKRSPFTAVRYPTPRTIEVQLSSDAWSQLLSLNDLPTPDLIAACKSLDQKDWQKRFEEDLIEALTRTGHVPPSVNTVDLRVKDLATDQEQTLKSVPMTEANRWKLWKARNQKPKEPK